MPTRLERLPSIEPNAQVAIAQCLPYGQRLTYWPLRGVLYRLIGVPDDARPNAVRQSIAAWLQGSGLEALDREVEFDLASSNRQHAVALGEAGDDRCPGVST